MRLRPFTALTAAAVTALLLAGCAGPGEASPTPTPTSTCAFDLPTGAASEAITVSGTAPDLTVEIPDGLEITELQRTVLSEGEGPELHTGSFVTGSYQIIDAATGEPIVNSKDLSADGTGQVPMLLDPQQYSVFAAALECLPLGSRTVLTIPGTAFGEGGTSVVVAAEATGEPSLRATGAPQPAVAGMPTVALSDTGAPTITLPGGDAPTDVQLATLALGDGPTVASGDTVFVQYTGVKWSDGSVFDSSWDRGSPAAFATTGVVEGFQKALEGQTVGSQMLVVVPPAFGYGASEESELKDETLVFVVDILGVERAAQPTGGAPQG